MPETPMPRLAGESKRAHVRRVVEQRPGLTVRDYRELTGGDAQVSSRLSKLRDRGVLRMEQRDGMLARWYPADEAPQPAAPSVSHWAAVIADLDARVQRAEAKRDDLMSRLHKVERQRQAAALALENLRKLQGLEEAE